MTTPSVRPRSADTTPASKYDDATSVVIGSKADGSRAVRAGGKDTMSELCHTAYPDSGITNIESRFVLWCLHTLGRMPHAGEIIHFSPLEQMLDEANQADQKLVAQVNVILRDGITITRNRQVREHVNEQKQADRDKMAPVLGDRPKVGVGGGNKARRAGTTRTKLPKKKKKSTTTAVAHDLARDKEVKAQQEEVTRTVDDAMTTMANRPESKSPAESFAFGLFGNILGEIAGKAMGGALEKEVFSGKSDGADMVKTTVDAAGLGPKPKELLAEMESAGSTKGVVARAGSFAVNLMALPIAPVVAPVRKVIESTKRHQAAQPEGVSKQKMQEITDHLSEHMDTLLVRIGECPTAWDRDREGKVIPNLELNEAMLRNIAPEQLKDAIRTVLETRTPPIENAAEAAEHIADDIVEGFSMRFINSVRRYARQNLEAMQQRLTATLEPKLLEALTNRLQTLKGPAREKLFGRFGLDTGKAPTTADVRKALLEASENLASQLPLPPITQGSAELFESYPWATVGAARKMGVRLGGDLEMHMRLGDRNLLEVAVERQLDRGRFLKGAWEFAAIFGTAGAGTGVSNLFNNKVLGFLFGVMHSSTPDLLDFVAAVAQE